MARQPINRQNSWVGWLEVSLSALLRGMILIPLGLICSSVVTFFAVATLRQLVGIDIFWSIGDVWVRLICGGVVGLAMWLLAWGINRALGLARLPIWAYPALVVLAMAFAMLPSMKSGFSAAEQRLSFMYLGMRVGMLCSIVTGILLRLRLHLWLERRVRAAAARDALAVSFIQSRTASLVRPRSNQGMYVFCKALCILPVFVCVCCLAVYGWEYLDVP